MKTRTTALICVALAALLVTGFFAVQVFAPKPELKLKVKWKPASYTSDSWFPDPWLAEIYFAPPRPITEIDPSTLLLENMYSPSAPPYPHPLKERLVVPFYGGDVVSALMSKVPHYGSGTFVIFLEITGKLYSGQAFRGTGSINMTIPDLPPP